MPAGRQFNSLQSAFNVENLMAETFFDNWDGIESNTSSILASKGMILISGILADKFIRILSIFKFSSKADFKSSLFLKLIFIWLS